MNLSRIKHLTTASVVTAMGLFAQNFYTTPAHAGGVASGGGKGVVCRNQDGSIQSVELLDLWEAREIFGRSVLKAEDTDLSAKELFNEATENLKNGFNQFSTTDDFNPEYFPKNQYPRTDETVDDNYVRGNMSFTAKTFFEEEGASEKLTKINAKLQPVNDSFEIATPDNGCTVEQIVRFDDVGYASGKIYVDNRYFSKLDKVNLAALVTHEALYKILRNWTSGKNSGIIESNSTRIRKAVGLLYSGYIFKGPVDYLKNEKEYYECREADTDPKAGLTTRIYIMMPKFSHIEKVSNYQDYRICNIGYIVQSLAGYNILSTEISNYQTSCNTSGIFISVNSLYTDPNISIDTPYVKDLPPDSNEFAISVRGSSVIPDISNLKVSCKLVKGAN